MWCRPTVCIHVWIYEDGSPSGSGCGVEVAAAAAWGRPTDTTATTLGLCVCVCGCVQEWKSELDCEWVSVCVCVWVYMSERLNESVNECVSEWNNESGCDWVDESVTVCVCLCECECVFVCVFVCVHAWHEAARHRLRLPISLSDHSRPGGQPHPPPPHPPLLFLGLSPSSPSFLLLSLAECNYRWKVSWQRAQESRLIFFLKGMWVLVYVCVYVSVCLCALWDCVSPLLAVKATRWDSSALQHVRVGRPAYFHTCHTS